MASQRRIIKEVQEVGEDDKVTGIKAVPVTVGDIRHLKGIIPGPQGTPYEGGIFEIDILLPEQYPFQPPKMKYLTKIWHPNICSHTGRTDILKAQWSPASTIKTALLSLQALMCSAEPKDPQDSEVAKMYVKDRQKFDETAKFWTELYTKPTAKEDTISRVCELGFDRESTRKALEKHGWDEVAALNQLLGM